ncbi:TIGR03619 family F420-dependent LLM class oxidoreductase [Cryptosporangium aurantiacum]|uniref:Probable F420-dependent oxidoreductase, Rv2161c family n=1 Tax=Cryptosporangium aurantiacum TaxID=134849 RepID=A0A1M7L6K7_9ACTN|nr:TIGR03619 family F420-dependent LLM class oxidoreductase [Cryptosporangium aurantiacum]SHM73546.1 probable F420-dependent oxidoreductase, Rv2161c family [Cryptosporangium aurantiacum]
MDIGFGLPVAGGWATPENTITVARHAEELGYRTLWSFQRLLVPDAQPLPPQYLSVLDPLVALAYAAGTTERIGLGTAIVNAPFTAPAVLGQQLATLDVLSRGRLLAGLGLGWLPAEFAAAGVPFERRGARFEEYLRCLDAVWGPDPVAFEGEFYRIEPSTVLPKPVQRPRPPVLIGGDAPRALERAGRLADGWISRSTFDLTKLGPAVTTVRTAAEKAGRDPDALRFVCRGVVLVGERKGLLTGSLDEIKADLPVLEEQGITEVFVDLNFDPAVGSVDVDAAVALRHALTVLDALAPGRRP